MQKRVKYYRKRLKNGLKVRKIQVKNRKNMNGNIIIDKKLLLYTKIDIIKLIILQYDIKSS